MARRRHISPTSPTKHIRPFFNDARPEAYSPDSAQKAWDRTLAFLRANLG